MSSYFTVKSDDTSGRVKTYEAIVKGENIPPAEIPESFKVLVKEMKSLCLDVSLTGSNKAAAPVEEEEEETLIGGIAEEPVSEEAVDALDLLVDGLAADLADLGGEEENDILSSTDEEEE